jgi:hypothetical protein
MVVLMFAAGCGNYSGAPGQSQQSAGASTVQPAASASGAGELRGSSGSPVPVTAGKVEVRLGKASYRVSETLRVTVANGLGTSIYTEDFKTVCSIVMLQRAESSGWRDIDGCQLGRPTVTVMIGAGLGQTVEIDPNSTHLQDGGTRIGFGAGVYRIKFGYRLDRGRMGEEPLVVYSPEFAVS